MCIYDSVGNRIDPNEGWESFRPITHKTRWHDGRTAVEGALKRVKTRDGKGNTVVRFYDLDKGKFVDEEEE